MTTARPGASEIRRGDGYPLNSAEESEEIFGQRGRISSFIRFGGLSGLGWLADSTLLYLLVRFAGLPVLRANLISATTAALLVFLLSRKLVFNAPATHLGVRLLIYSGYTLLVIVAASAAMKYISFGAFSLSRHFGYPLATSTCALVAKIVVTPPNFLLNYAVARITSEHGNTTV